MPLRAVSLRYFNVAGAGSDDLGDPTAFNLVPIVFGHLLGDRRPMVFGCDYPTRDGTCVRDYVHVLDLADAHLAAIDWTGRPGAGHAIVNVGTGAGSSVLEVIGAASAVAGIESTPSFAPRRGRPTSPLRPGFSLTADRCATTGCQAALEGRRSGCRSATLAGRRNWREGL